MAKDNTRDNFGFKWSFYEKGPARSQPRGVIVIIAINQLEYKKDLCCLSLGDWTKLPPHFMCQCYAQWSYWNFFSIYGPTTKRAGRQKKDQNKRNTIKQQQKKRGSVICSTDQENKANIMLLYGFPLRGPERSGNNCRTRCRTHDLTVIWQASKERMFNWHMKTLTHKKGFPRKRKQEGHFEKC